MPKSEFDNIDKLIASEFDELIDLSKVDTKIKTWLDTGVYALNYACSKNLFGGIPVSRITSVDGLSGCISRDTKIRVKRGKRVSGRVYTAEDLYTKFYGGNVGGHKKWNTNIPSMAYSYNEISNSISYNKIVDVVKKGEKEVYELVLDDGKKIKVTNDHPFKVRDDLIGNRGIPEKENFVMLKNVVVGDFIYCMDNNGYKGKFHRSKRNEIYVKYHPSNVKKNTVVCGKKYVYKRIPFSRVVFESNLNNLSINDFIHRLNHDVRSLEELSFIENGMVIHHKDRNPLNDTIDNLELLTKKQHDSLHGKEDSFKYFGKNIMKYEKVVSINKIGNEMTYDLVMNTPNRNYLANDIIVHNTGKSLILASIMKDPKIDYIFLIESEGGGSAEELYDFVGVDKSKIKLLKANTFGNYRIKIKDPSVIEEVADSKFPKKKKTEEYIYVEGATRLVKRILSIMQMNEVKKNVLVLLDTLGNLQSVRELSGTSDMGARSKDITTFFRNFDVAFEKGNVAFIFANKLYTNIGDQWNPWKVAGGVSVEYNPSLSIRLTDTSETDDVSDKEMKEEKERRKTALGSSIKTVKARITKSRFGTEMRSVNFLIDFAVGPVKYSGLFNLCKDFGLLDRSGSTYKMEGVFDKSFYKKDFINMIIEDEENSLNKIQARLEEAEKEIADKKKHLQINDINDIDDIVEAEDEDNAEMIKLMTRDVEN